MSRSLVALLLLATPELAAGQCSGSVSPQPGDLGYRDRNYACEGFYVGAQSAPLGVQVVSFLRGGWPAGLAPEGVVRLVVPDLGAELSEEVEIVGRARTDATRWALDGRATSRTPLGWDLSEVIGRSSVEIDQLGVFGRAATADGLARTVFVPVRVDAGGAPAGPAPSEMVVRVIGAGSLCWSMYPDPPCSQTAEELQADGYFQVDLPAVDGPREDRLQIWWRPTGEPSWGDPETIRIYRW